jgi:hypothetical protein
MHTSPMRSSGIPMTAACAMPPWPSSRFSISAGYALKPPVMNMSFMRSVIQM